MASVESCIRRKIAAQTAVRLLENDFVVLDTETTGLDRSARIVSLAVVDKTGNALIDTLINPGVRIPRDATAIHGITDRDVADAPRMTDVLPQLETFCATHPTYIYNAEFDLKMLRQHVGRPPAMLRSACVMKLYAEFRGERGSYGTFRWHKLTAACAQLGISGIEERAHSAVGDCLRTLAVLRAMADWHLHNT